MDVSAQIEINEFGMPILQDSSNQESLGDKSVDNKGLRELESCALDADLTQLEKQVTNKEKLVEQLGSALI